MWSCQSSRGERFQLESFHLTRTRVSPAPTNIRFSCKNSGFICQKNNLEFRHSFGLREKKNDIKPLSWRSSTKDVGKASAKGSESVNVPPNGLYRSAIKGLLNEELIYHLSMRDFPLEGNPICALQLTRMQPLQLYVVWSLSDESWSTLLPKKHLDFLRHFC